MSTYSRSDLATRALRKANIIGAEETPSAADLEFAEETIASDTAALAEENIVIFNGSDQSVPISYLEPLAAYHAVTMKADYGMISDAEAEQTKAFMRSRLYRLSATPATGSAVEGSYY